MPPLDSLSSNMLSTSICSPAEGAGQAFGAGGWPTALVHPESGTKMGTKHPCSSPRAGSRQGGAPLSTGGRGWFAQGRGGRWGLGESIYLRLALKG